MFLGLNINDMIKRLLKVITLLPAFILLPLLSMPIALLVYVANGNNVSPVFIWDKYCEYFDIENEGMYG